LAAGRVDQEAKGEAIGCKLVVVLRELGQGLQNWTRIAETNGLMLVDDRSLGE
jgi:uncharacterized Fe-S cluster-containing radical SAM superfamily protein